MVSWGSEGNWGGGVELERVGPRGLPLGGGYLVLRSCPLRILLLWLQRDDFLLPSHSITMFLPHHRHKSNGPDYYGLKPLNSWAKLMLSCSIQMDFNIRFHFRFDQQYRYGIFLVSSWFFQVFCKSSMNS